MTKVYYDLGNGKIVDSYEEALNYGVSFKVCYDENSQRELNEKEPTPEEIEKMENRYNKLAEKYPSLA